MLSSEIAALVFNCHFNGLSMIQELGRRGFHIIALDTHRSVGTHSRYAHHLQCPDPMIAEQRFVAYLLRLGPGFDWRPSYSRQTTTGLWRSRVIRTRSSNTTSLVSRIGQRSSGQSTGDGSTGRRLPVDTRSPDVGGLTNSLLFLRVLFRLLRNPHTHAFLAISMVPRIFLELWTGGA